MNSHNTLHNFFLALFALLLCLSSCNSSDKQVVISGDIQHGRNGMIRLARLDNAEMVKIDSVRMRNGHFEFVLTAATEEQKEILARPMLYQLSLSDDNTLTTLAQKGEHIHISASADNLIQTYRAKGGREAVLMTTLDSALTAFVKQVQPLWNFYQQHIDNDTLRENVEAQYYELVNQHTRFLRKFIKEHPSDMASYVAFYQSYNRLRFFDNRKDFDLMKKLTETLSARYPNHPYLQKMQQKVELLESQQYDTD